jgi:hypothetical protein
VLNSIGFEMSIRHIAFWRFCVSGAASLLTCVLVLAFFDWLLFETPLVAPRLPLDDDGSPGDKLILVDRYRDAEVVHLGDSRIMYGVRPDEVSKACGCGPGFNAAFPAADPILTREMAQHVLREVSPDVLVVGVSQWELSDAAYIRVWGPAPELVKPWRLPEFGVAVTNPFELFEALGQSWRLYRYRGELKAALDPSSNTRSESSDRRGFDEYQGRKQLDNKDIAERQEQWFRDFSVSGRRRAALQQLVSDLRAKNLGVVLLAPPLYPDLLNRVGPEVAMFKAAMHELATEQGAMFEDVTEPERIGLNRDDFRDPVHLDEDATEELSRYLGKVIRSKFTPA